MYLQLFSPSPRFLRIPKSSAVIYGPGVINMPMNLDQATRPSRGTSKFTVIFRGGTARVLPVNADQLKNGALL